MNIIIIGAGKVGRKLVEEFENEDHSVVIVDTKEDLIDEIQNDYDVMGICGNGIDIEALDEAGVKDCDLAICVTDRDEINALCAIIAKRKGAKSCVARIRNRQYFKQLGFMRDELGINLIINPELYAANEISRMLRFPAATKTETFANGRIEIAELKLPESLENRKVSEIYKKYKLKLLICAVGRSDKVIIPNGEFVLQRGDKIHINGSHANIAKFLKLAGVANLKLKTVMIIGGGRISYYLANQLMESGMRVKIIEKSREKCLELSEYIPGAKIVCGDGTDRSVLDEEGIGSVDSFVSLTGIDEENIVTSMYAKMKKVDKVVTKINRIPFAEMIDAAGIDSVVTPKDATANVIVGYVRAMSEADDDSEVVSLYRIINNKAEAIEFKVSRESGVTGRPLKDLRLKKNILIGAIVKKNKGRSDGIPDGDSVIEVGDSVVVVTTENLKRLTDILA